MIRTGASEIKPEMAFFVGFAAEPRLDGRIRKTHPHSSPPPEGQIKRRLLPALCLGLTGYGLDGRLDRLFIAEVVVAQRAQLVIELID